MDNSLRLNFIGTITDESLNELWNNCFVGADNMKHMNAHVPYPVNQQWQLNGFLTNQHNYKAWLIKRKHEHDIIGFVIYGNFIPGLTNNVGFNIGLQYTKKGYATETLQALVEHIRTLGHTKAFGHCFETNSASKRTMENCGFQNMGPTGQIYNGINELKFKIEL
ncbi:MAG: GNAT family N-acetyltransferase [Bacteroidales bacterium]|jgi:RimJ/RimL family protein N-acetyltransferase|nr:GNAT family N-acetyltransferase [Bacteroidales bacterium]MDY0370675.1 GNAT family N-acetyltransferase [Bacteroidales bacterium]